MIKLKDLIQEGQLESDIEHTVGNSLFAMETNMEPLRKRIRENRIEEALSIVDDLQSSINKAKTGLFKWKDSLDNVTEVTKEPTVRSFRQIHQDEDPSGQRHDLRLTCVECGTTSTCRCSKPKREFKGLCDTCAKVDENNDFLAKFGVGPKYKAPEPVKRKCPKCNKENAVVRESHADTDMNEMVLECPDCGCEVSL